MQILNFFFIMLLTDLSSHLYADSYRFSYFFVMPLPIGGKFSPNTQSLQYRSDIGDRFDISVKTGNNIGLLYGVGYGIQSTDYSQYHIVPGGFLDYFSRHYFYYLKAGYWISLHEKTMFEISVAGGYGELRFAGTTGSTTIFKNVKSLSVDAKINFLLTTFSSGLKLNIFGGIEILKPFVKDFVYEGQRFNSSDFNDQFLIPVGVGLEF